MIRRESFLRIFQARSIPRRNPQLEISSLASRIKVNTPDHTPKYKPQPPTLCPATPRITPQPPKTMAFYPKDYSPNPQRLWPSTPRTGARTPTSMGYLRSRTVNFLFLSFPSFSFFLSSSHPGSLD